MSKNACSQGHFCEAVNVQGERSERRRSRKVLRSKTFLHTLYICMCQQARKKERPGSSDPGRIYSFSGVYLPLGDALALYLPDEALQRRDDVRADIPADEDEHDVVSDGELSSV